MQQKGGGNGGERGEGGQLGPTVVHNICPTPEEEATET